MAGLFSSLSMAARSLEAQRAGLDTAGRNIANLNTPGYARRRLELAEVVNGTGGVEVVGERSLRDAVLDARVRTALAPEAREGAVAGALAPVEIAIGAPGQGLDSRLSAFFDAWSALAAEPSSPVVRDTVALRGQQLASSFNDVAAQLAEAGRLADRGVRGALGELNALTGQIASLNEAIAGGGSAGDVEALRDRQQVALEELTKLAAVSVVTRSDGGLDVMLPSGRPLVFGATASPVVASTGANGYAALTLGGVTVTGEFTTGRIGGLAAARDTYIPAYQARLDDLAYQVAQRVNTVHQTGTDLTGAAGGVFFTAPGAVAGAAAALSVSPAIVGNTARIAASQTGAPGDNGTARAIVALREAATVSGGTATFTQGWAQLTFRVGADIDDALARQQTARDVSAEVQRLRDQVSGVSLDEEAASLIKFQTAYEANAKYFSAVDSALDTLMRLVGA